MKKIVIVIIGVCLLAAAGFVGFGIWHSTATTPKFEAGGYILQGEEDELKWLSFQSGESYASTLAGTISFNSTESGRATVSKESFVHLDNGSVMALSDGILLDFNDLSENFINNYYISAGLPVTASGGEYTAETNAGSMRFGEHLWKLSDRKYIVESPKLTIYFSEDDVRETEDYVQVVVTEDQVIHLLTQENLWMTISKDCYIETEGGVKIYPVSQLVDDGTYKLSLAKLSVSADDAIVLTEDETRRQIVPELNIEAVDGEDGEDGEDGQAGQAGENGDDGEAGVSGRDGETGESGQTGAAGAAGETGSTGKSGSSGSSGADGAAGSNGDGGKNGGTGTAGKDAVVESTTNSALPTMTITDWQVSANDLKGCIAVTDNGDFLNAISELSDFSTRYPGSVTIINVSTGEEIPCYEANEDYVILDTTMESDFSQFYEGTEEVYFSTQSGALEPDTEYRLSVTAYYKATDQTGLIYSREFISRSFYTDSTGVILTYVLGTQTGLTLSASVSESYQASIVSAKVFLLTPDQNESFTTASIDNANNYVAVQDIGFDGNSVVEVGFEGLTPDTRYIARVYVETNAGLKTLTQQELELETLKRTPTTDSGAVPTAVYNRVTGAFEVRRPVVTDPDGGAVSYTYTAYRQTEDGGWEEVSSRSITASAGEPVEFRLSSGELYRFGVELTFHDNEKTVYFDLGYSATIKSEGDTMPKITLTPESSGQDYNKYSGTLKISLGASSSISEVSEYKPMRLEIYADQIQNSSVELTETDKGITVAENMGTVTLSSQDVTENTNEVVINLNLENLYKNTNYTITVYGYLDLGDGNGVINRAIGTVSFRTYDTVTLSASWQTPSDISTAFARTLTLSVQDSTASNSRVAYAQDQLMEGQVTVELYSGIGTGKLRIAQKNFNDSEVLAQLYSTGYQITEDDFGSPILDPSGNYTLTVSSVADGSYELDLGYINEFESLLNPSEVVSAEPTPPDLLTDPSKGVLATPIYNADAVTYGAKVDETLPDDAIIGYTLEATYDNVQRIGKTVTYYAYEYTTFFNALAQSDPLQVAEPLMKMTLDIDSGSDKVPKVAVLFGGTKTESDEESSYWNGYWVYYAGETSFTSSLVSGMGRGFRYIFAYTVEYTGSSGESESVKTYPYSHKEYDLYNTYHGGVKENNVEIGKGVAYILNSGMCSAPEILPDFHSYVYRSTPATLASANSTTAEGKVELHYTWRDPDGLIVTDGTDQNTKITFEANSGQGTATQNIQATEVDGATGWYTITLPYTVQKSDSSSSKVLTPNVNVSEYRMNYNAILRRFNLTEDAENCPLAAIPVDWPWADQFTQNGYTEVLVTMVEHLEENYIDFNLVDSEVATALASRAAAMKLTISLTDGTNEKTFYLPLVSDVNGTHARLTTGLLGTEYLHRDFQVTEAAILYDTGTQGWQLAEQGQGSLFTLQYINEVGGAFGFSDYLGGYDNSTLKANGALHTVGSFSVGNLRGTIDSGDPDRDTKVTLSTSNPLLNRSGITTYLYPAAMGVDSHTNSQASQLSGRYLTVKEIGTYTLTFASGKNTGTLDTMTPTMTQNYFSTSGSSIGVSGLNVAGFSGTGTIYMAAYASYEDATKLNTQFEGTPLTIEIGTDGYPTGLESGTVPTLTGLTGEKKYYVAFYYTNDAGNNVLLLRSDTAEAAIYEVTTSTKAVITITEMEYLNSSYFDKSLTAEFTISRIFGLSMRYDIFSSQDEADKDGATPLLSYEELHTEDENNILTVPSVLSYNNNKVQLNLKPDTARAKLKPGTTYYLKITALESDGTVAGSAVQPFEITAVGSYGALIYVSNTTSDQITFTVTINDPQYTFMTVDSDAGKTAGGLYAVRFTDSEGRWIHTSYDDEVFPMSELKKEFTLNDDTILNDNMNFEVNKQIKADTAYTLRVYAVPDDDHDGSIILSGENKTWTDFFEAVGDTISSWGSKLLKIIDSFWNPDTTNDGEKDAVESQLLVAKKEQKTTTEGDNWLLNEAGIYTSRENVNTVRVIFEESFGLIQDDEPVFRQLDWQIEGRTADGTPLAASGTLRYSNSDTLLMSGTDSGGYPFYYFDIPYTVGQGSYSIVLQFRTTEGTEAAVRTITIRSGV